MIIFLSLVAFFLFRRRKNVEKKQIEQIEMEKKRVEMTVVPEKVIVLNTECAL